MSTSPATSFLISRPSAASGLVSAIDVPAWQHPLRGTAGPVPADRQHAPAGSEQHGADTLDHPSPES
jgi:hypothetical protein